MRIPALTVLILLAACTATTSSIDEQEPYKIGIVLPFTGEAPYGEALALMMELANLNTSNSLEFIYEDGKCTAKDALIAARKLVDTDGVQAIYGGACSSEVLGMAPFTQERRVLLLTPFASSKDITDAGDLVFRSYPSDERAVEKLVEHMRNQDRSRVALLSENTDYAQSYRAGFLEQIPDLIVSDQVIPRGDLDVRSQVTKIRTASPDTLVILPQAAPTAIAYLQEVTKQNLDVALYGNEIFLYEDARSILTMQVNGMYFTQNDFEETPAFIEAASECPFGIYCATAHDGILLLDEAFTACGDEPNCIRDFLYNITWQGVFTGNLSFDENGDVPGEFVLYQFQDNTAVRLG